ncbi:hypothetical protein [Chryseobacterium sp. A321]
MKSIYSIFTILLIAVLFTSCRRDGVPEDIHEHEEIEQITLSFKEQGSTSAPQVITYLGGKASSDLILAPGKNYELSLDFFHRHDGHLESMLGEIIEEKDEHFITFEFAGVDLELTRLPNDVIRSDGQKLGLKTLWKVSQVQSPTRVSVKLYHGSQSVNDQMPSAQKQFGEVIGGEADVNAQIEIKN